MPEFNADAAPPQDLTSLAWAIWTFQDRTGAVNLTDGQISARLGLHVRVVGGVTYYRPLAAAADYVTRPDQMVERGRNDLNDKYIDPFKVAAELKALQAQLDQQIPAPDDGSPSTDEFDPTLTFTGWG